MKQLRISDQVADYIVRLILEEGLGPGDALPSESELARQFEVSRPAVREATNALAGRGLITVSSGRSPTVSALAQAPFANLMNHGLAIGQVRMLDVMNVRRGLEEVAAELAALNRSPEQAAELERLAAALGAARGDVETFWRLDIQFHKTLAEASDNHLLASLLAGISEVASRSTRSGLSLARNAEEWGVIVEVHLETAAGVIAGDPGRARAGMAAHFASAIGRFERALTQNRGPS